jgi:hypothetical protein
MIVSEDDKWYISDAAISAMPALINSLKPPALINSLKPTSTSDAEAQKYAHGIGVLAHLIGLEMLVSRNNTYAALETVSKEEGNASA